MIMDVSLQKAGYQLLYELVKSSPGKTPSGFIEIRIFPVYIFDNQLYVLFNDQEAMLINLEIPL